MGVLLRLLLLLFLLVLDVDGVVGVDRVGDAVTYFLEGEKI
jgi:hypothetical protein